MARLIEVALTPAELAGVRNADLSQTLCVVFDVLRATSVMVTAFANGAAAFIPVAEISEALAIRRGRPEILLGGERNGLRISAQVTGGVEFDLGNSPREYTREKVAGKTIVSTTTNGTRALRACAGAKAVAAGSLLNLKAVAEFAAAFDSEKILAVCAGTVESAALEDVIAAGALCDLLQSRGDEFCLADSAQIARRAYRDSEKDFVPAVRASKNARRLLSQPALRDDVEFCLRRDVFEIVPTMNADGVIGPR